MTLLGRRRDGGRWEVLEGATPERVRPDGAWDTLLLLELGAEDRLAVREFTVPPPEWREIERPTR